MTAIFEIEASVRHEIGKRASRRLRRLEKVPAITYGGEGVPMALALDNNKMMKALEQEAFYSHVLTLKTAQSVEHVILKAVQRHPYKRLIMSMDFQRIRADERLTMHVPIHFVQGDEAPGVKAGGIVLPINNSVEVSCLPKDLPEYLTIDLATLELNQTLHLSDIPLPVGLELVALAHGDDRPIVAIHLPQTSEKEEQAATDSSTTDSSSTTSSTTNK